MIKQIRARNILSFGPTSEALVLGRLNVFVGANASGKSNLIEVIGLLRSSPRELAVPIREGGGIGAYLNESNRMIPAARLSDGTLRFLSLLSVLHHPTPAPLIAIEEPELGLHPDIIPRVAEILQDAAQRTQLIVTTHSSALVDALSETPEVVVVTRRRAGRPCSSGSIAASLECGSKYSLFAVLVVDSEDRGPNLVVVVLDGSWSRCGFGGRAVSPRPSNKSSPSTASPLSGRSRSAAELGSGQHTASQFLGGSHSHWGMRTSNQAGSK